MMRMNQYDTVHRVEGHQCSLPQEDDLVGLYINGGCCVGTRRRFRRYLMVDAANPDAKTVLKSTAQLRHEESHHLKNYYCMIHPFSRGRINWETFMIVVYCLLFMVMPLEMCMPTIDPLASYLKFLCDVFSLIDIVVTFFSGYFNEKTRRIVMKPGRVFLHYILSYFIFDVVSSIPYQMLLMATGTTNTRWWRIKYLFVFKLVRLPTFLKYLRKLFERLEIWSYKFTAFNFCLTLLIAIWWETAITFIADSTSKGHDVWSMTTEAVFFEPMMRCAYQVMKASMLIQISNIESDSCLSLIFNLCSLFGGAIINMLILAQVIQLYRRYSGSQNKYESLMQQIDAYMKYKEMPGSLKNRVFHFVEFKFQKNIFRESDILLSKILKEDVVLHNCKKLVERVDFFKHLPSALILRLVSKLKSEIYLPNDTIVSAGMPGYAMYFIYMGTVAVYTITNKEICHLEDGSHFGEISLVINEPRVASVVAVTDCEVFRLSRKDFQEAVEPYPALCDEIRLSALRRLNDTRVLLLNEI